MRLIELMATAVLVAGLGACSSGGAGGGAPTNCVDVSGSWSLSGSCPISSCAVTQNGCNVTLVCGSDTYTGTVSGSTISFSDPQAGNCSGSVSSSSTSGSCSGASGSCSFNGSCSSGPCGAPSTGGGGGGGFGGGGTGGGGFGGGGTGGGGSVDCNAACEAITNCCTLSLSDCLTGCQQNAPTAACQACFTNTSCGAFVPCVTAQCGVPSALCPSPPEP